MSHPTALYVDAGIQASKYSNVGMFAVLIFDYFITLEAESLWVWHRKWTFVRFIFTVSRYLPFFGIGMTFIAALRTQYYPGESQRCSVLGLGKRQTVSMHSLRYINFSSTPYAVLHIICIVAAEGLLITRIYASWNKGLMLNYY
ncbi:hypothetical protein F4604DRAFT_1677235 [Suillus subluteus]|nr:hypothetical protein F4604DRAFT_1677235 [Suillus subluteus]